MGTESRLLKEARLKSGESLRGFVNSDCTRITLVVDEDILLSLVKISKVEGRIFFEDYDMEGPLFLSYADKGPLFVERRVEYLHGMGKCLVGCEVRIVEQVYRKLLSDGYYRLIRPTGKIYIYTKEFAESLL